MARISGVNIPLNKRVEIGLTYIYGIGRSTSNRLLGQALNVPTTTNRIDPAHGCVPCFVSFSSRQNGSPACPRSH